MKKINIIYTIPNFDTCGSGIALIKLISNLNKNIFNVSIVCLHDQGYLFKKLKELNIDVIIYNYISELKPRYKLFFNIFKISLFFRKFKPDLIFSYHYGSNFSEALAANLAGAKFIYVKKNMSWYGPSHNQWKIKTYLASAITVQNSDMIKEFFFNNKKAHLISIGVDTTEYKSRVKNYSLLEEFKLDYNNKIILTVANIIPKKGLNFLIKGFLQSNLFNENVVLFLVGDDNNDLGYELKSLVRTLKLEKYIIFTGKRFDVTDFYSIADLFILPSTGNEGAPIAIQEAMASGVIVITTDTPGNRDQLNLLPDQLIPPNDETAIANSIVKYINIGKDKKDKIIKKQLEIINQSYTLTNEVTKHEELYKNLVFND